MDEYQSEKELYEALIPALKVKLRLLKEKGYDYLTKENIWTYLKVKVWSNSVGLSISEMVSHIINLNPEELKAYVAEKEKDPKEVDDNV